MKENKEKSKYISLKQAAKISGYSSDHIGFLIREKKIKGRKISLKSSWKITPKEIIKCCKKTKNLATRDSSSLLRRRYLSLKQAAKISGYSSDYIGFLIREGKLKGRKAYSGVSLQTTKRAVMEYKNRKTLKLTQTRRVSVPIPVVAFKVVAFKKLKKQISEIKNCLIPWIKHIKTIKTFQFGWRFALAAFVVLFLLSGFAPIKFLQNSVITAITGGETEIINFYPTQFTGGWQNSENAQGPPDVLSNGDINNFSEANSAVYKTGALTLICGEFVSEELSDDDVETDTGIDEFVEELTEVEEDVAIEEVSETEEIATTTEEIATTTEPAENLPARNASHSDAGGADIQAGGEPALPDDSILETDTPAQNEIIIIEETIEATTTEEIEAADEIISEPVISDEPISFFEKAKRELKNIFGSIGLVQAQENKVFQSAKIKFSFALGEKEQDILLEEPVGFWNSFKKSISRIKTWGSKFEEAVKGIGDLIIVEAEENIEDEHPEVLSNIDDKIIIWYSLDGESWDKLGIISSSPLSNALNHGYFEYEAPLLKSEEGIKNLKIKFDGTVGGETNITAYLDSVWVEASYTKENETKHEIDTKDKPRIRIKDSHLLISPLGEKSFHSNEEPVFVIKEPEFTVKQLQELVNVNEAEIIEGEFYKNQETRTASIIEPIKEFIDGIVEEVIENVLEPIFNREDGEPAESPADNQAGGEPALPDDSILETDTPAQNEIIIIEPAESPDPEGEPAVPYGADNQAGEEAKTMEAVATTTEEIATTTEPAESPEDNQAGGEIIGAMKKAIKKIVFVPQVAAQVEPNNFRIKIFNPMGQESLIEAHVITKFIDNKQGFEIKIPKPGRDFYPGKWKMEIEIETDEAILISEQDFTWGVLAININKSIYLSGSDSSAYIQMGVLDDIGKTICNADLTLIVKSPAGVEKEFSTEDETIQRSSECGPSTITNTPDYYAYYDIPDELGLYELYLTAITRNGVREIFDSFEVRESVAFDVERIGPTRIYPPAFYEVTLKIKANEDFVGQVIESAPASFEVVHETGTKLNTKPHENTKEIIWQVDWEAGEEYELKYQFDAPDISPYLYLLGPLEFHSDSLVFKELRSWQIAVDAAISSAQTGNWDATSTWSGGVVPTSADDVTILDTHTVTVNVSNATSSSLTINSGGTLTFLNSTDTSLTTNGTTSITGTLSIGTSGARIGSSYTAALKFNSSADDACDLTVNSGGALNMYGAVLSYYKTTLASNATSSQADLITSDTTGWVAGDILGVGGNSFGESEKMTISSVSGTTITLTGNLSNTHVTGSYIINLTRNAVIEETNSASYQSDVNVSSGGDLNIDCALFKELGHWSSQALKISSTDVAIPLKNSVFTGSYRAGGGSNPYATLVLDWGANNLKIENVFSYDGGYLAFFRAQLGEERENCIAMYHSANGFDILDGSSGAKHTNCIAIDCGAGFAVRHSVQRSYSNCKAYACTTGFHVSGATSIILDDCEFGGTIGNNTSRDIYLASNVQAYVRGNGKLDSATKVENIENAYYGSFVKIEDYGGTKLASKSWYKAGTVTKDTGVTHSGGASSSAKLEPNSTCTSTYPLRLSSDLDRGDFVVWASAAATTVTVYIRSLGVWSSYPTNSELYIQAEYWDDAGSAERATSTASTQVLSDETTWVAFTTTFTPVQAGWVYVKVYLKKYEASKGIYVDIKPVIE
ncbi:G8 domain-containing protein [Candidatus Parcubacteria bacterium]|nr:G8 domain-containing protein [Candidatus Parcubacteria bacterium]